MNSTTNQYNDAYDTAITKVYQLNRIKMIHQSIKMIHEWSKCMIPFGVSDEDYFDTHFHIQHFQDIMFDLAHGVTTIDDYVLSDVTLAQLQELPGPWINV